MCKLRCPWVRCFVDTETLLCPCSSRSCSCCCCWRCCCPSSSSPGCKSCGGRRAEMGSKPSTPGGAAAAAGNAGGRIQVGLNHGTTEHDSFLDAEQSIGGDEEGARYILQEDWLAGVCGIPRRRLTVKNGDDPKAQSKDTKLDNLKEEEPPSPEEIAAWSESFDKLMQSGGRKVFREFLRSEYSEENMLFWLAVEELKKEKNAELVEEKARLIYEDYISILSPKEVSLDAQVREIINKNMVDPTPHTFDEAQLQIYTLMHRDSYPRFLNSQMYKRLIQ